MASTAGETSGARDTSLEHLKFQEKTGGQQSGFNFADVMRSHQADVDQTVEQRLQRGDYIRPSNQFPRADVSAADLAMALARDGNLEVHNAQINANLDTDPAMRAYEKKANAATAGLEAQEGAMATAKWNDLPESTRATIAKELEASDQYLRTPGSKPPTTPELNNFINSLKPALEPLEQQRDSILRGVWKELPDQTKRSILRRDTLTPRYEILRD